MAINKDVINYNIYNIDQSQFKLFFIFFNFKISYDHHRTRSNKHGISYQRPGGITALAGTKRKARKNNSYYNCFISETGLLDR